MRDGLKGTWALASGSRGSGQTSAPKEDAGDPVKVAEQATESVKAVGYEGVWALQAGMNGGVGAGSRYRAWRSGNRI